MIQKDIVRLLTRGIAIQELSSRFEHVCTSLVKIVVVVIELLVVVVVVLVVAVVIVQVVVVLDVVVSTWLEASF